MIKLKYSLQLFYSTFYLFLIVVCYLLEISDLIKVFPLSVNKLKELCLTVNGYSWSVNLLVNVVANKSF